MSLVETAPQPGLRERKKEQVRQLIAETARSLFSERGFERVTVAEIAHVAEVSVQTVFNYFPTKEDLVYWRMESFEEELLNAIRDREPGESVLSAFGRFVRIRRGLLASQDPDAREQLVALTRMITESPSLLAREQRIFAEYTESLAVLIAAETGAHVDDTEPRVTATALIGVHRALIDYTRRHIISGTSQRRLREGVSIQAEKALRRLEHGLDGYAIKA